MVKNVKTISPDFSFADTLASFLLEKNKEKPEDLAKTVVLLPTRRACLTLHKSFLNQTAGRPVLLPRILSFGDLDNEETQWSFFAQGEKDLPPAIDDLKRSLLLTRLIVGKNDTSIDNAYLSAKTLCSLLDEISMYDVDVDDLQNIVPENLASHWQKILEFLQIILSYWPDILKEENVLDTVERRKRIFKRQSELWQKNPPDFPIIAAGSTGSQPATALLLNAVASLENGLVVLPGFDTSLPDDAILPETHPQYHMLRLLRYMEIAPSFVSPLTPTDFVSERLRLIRTAMMPAQTTDEWRHLPSFSNDAVNGVVRIDADNSAQEALIIALILRQTLQTPERTAAVVTPDRLLAQRIIGQMKRWGVVLDDSAGLPASHTPLGVFLELTALTAKNNFAPVDLLAFLKHPLTTLGLTLGKTNQYARLLEKKHLRGLQKSTGALYLKKCVADDDVLRPFIDNLTTRFGSFYELMTCGEKQSFETFLNAHIETAQALAESADKTGEERLWKGDAGQACSCFFARLKTNGALLQEISAEEYTSLLHTFLSAISVRSSYGTHPRIDILGTMEARLIRPDVLILAGLNEGSWPKNVQNDAWFSRPMRAQCRLPLPEQRIGLSAHDFTQGFCSPNVFLTRSVKEDGKSTVPSRWLSRLDTLLRMNNLSFNETDFKKWAVALDMPEKNIVFPPPSPKPPVEKRPRRLSVTQIETLMRDPYAIYAKEILRLKPLEELGRAPNNADYGTVIHAVLEDFCQHHPTKVTEMHRLELLKKGEEKLKEIPYDETQLLFFLPALKQALNKFFDMYVSQIDNVEKIYTEQKGDLTFKTPFGSFTLTGRADRIDILKDGSARIIDYKTKSVPTNKTVYAGYAPQLPLEAYMLQNGAFKNIIEHPRNVSFSYCAVNADSQKKQIDFENDGLSEKSFENLKELITYYDNPQNAYEASPDESLKPVYNDYDHLARYQEWSVISHNDGDDDND